MSGISASSPPFFPPQLKLKTSRCHPLSTSLVPCHLSDLKVSAAAVGAAADSGYSSDLKFRSNRLGVGFSRLRLQCRSSSNTPGSTGPGGNNDNRSILDAFFLGKALAEALNERIESTVGELLSSVGRFQAEQQKQVQEFQEDVLERAKRAKEKAAREAIEAQGVISKSTAIEKSAVTNGNSAISPSAPNDDTLAISPSLSDEPVDSSNTDPTNKDILQGTENDD